MEIGSIVLCVVVNPHKNIFCDNLVKPFKNLYDF